MGTGLHYTRGCLVTGARVMILVVAVLGGMVGCTERETTALDDVAVVSIIDSVTPGQTHEFVVSVDPASGARELRVEVRAIFDDGSEEYGKIEPIVVTDQGGGIDFPISLYVKPKLGEDAPRAQRVFISAEVWEIGAGEGDLALVRSRRNVSVSPAVDVVSDIIVDANASIVAGQEFPFTVEYNKEPGQEREMYLTVGVVVDGQFVKLSAPSPKIVLVDNTAKLPVSIQVVYNVLTLLAGTSDIIVNAEMYPFVDGTREDFSKPVGAKEITINNLIVEGDRITSIVVRIDNNPDDDIEGEVVNPVNGKIPIPLGDIFAKTKTMEVDVGYEIYDLDRELAVNLGGLLKQSKTLNSPEKCEGMADITERKFLTFGPRPPVNPPPQKSPLPIVSKTDAPNVDQKLIDQGRVTCSTDQNLCTFTVPVDEALLVENVTPAFTYDDLDSEGITVSAQLHKVDAICAEIENPSAKSEVKASFSNTPPQ